MATRNEWEGKEAVASEMKKKHRFNRGECTRRAYDETKRYETRKRSRFLKNVFPIGKKYLQLRFIVCIHTNVCVLSNRKL